MSMPPRKVFWSTVLAPLWPLSASCTLRLSLGQSRIIGSTRRRENFLASSIVGWTKRTVPGSWSMR